MNILLNASRSFSCGCVHSKTACCFLERKWSSCEHEIAVSYTRGGRNLESWRSFWRGTEILQHEGIISKCRNGSWLWMSGVLEGFEDQIRNAERKRGTWGTMCLHNAKTMAFKECTIHLSTDALTGYIPAPEGNVSTEELIPWALKGAIKGIASKLHDFLMATLSADNVEDKPVLGLWVMRVSYKDRKQQSNVMNIALLLQQVQKLKWHTKE